MRARPSGHTTNCCHKPSGGVVIISTPWGLTPQPLSKNAERITTSSTKSLFCLTLVYSPKNANGDLTLEAKSRQLGGHSRISKFHKTWLLIKISLLNIPILADPKLFSVSGICKWESQRAMLGYWIKATWVPGMTAHNTLDSHPPTFTHTILLDCFVSIV